MGWKIKESCQRPQYIKDFDVPGLFPAWNKSAQFKAYNWIDNVWVNFDSAAKRDAYYRELEEKEKRMASSAENARRWNEYRLEKMKDIVEKRKKRI